MAQIDLPLDQLRAYRPDLTQPDDFDDFWADDAGGGARSHPLDATFEPVDTGLAVIDTFDVTFRGFGGSPVRGWLHLPATRTGPLPGVVRVRRLRRRPRPAPTNGSLWAIAGYAHLMMDTRGQGSSWSSARRPTRTATAPPAQAGLHDPRHPGSGDVLLPARLHRRGARGRGGPAHPAVDAGRVAVTGGSQGGGISLAAPGSCRTSPAVMPDVPFLCDFPRVDRRSPTPTRTPRSSAT